MSRSFALGNDLEACIDRQIKCGYYTDASEVVRAGLRLLENQERLQQSEREEIARLIDEGRREAITVPATEVFDRLEACIKAEAGRSPG